jgi:tungstate transport system ATP-binding protein
MAIFAYQLNNINFAYDNAFNLQIDKLQIKSGNISGIIGHNGSGKTTLLKILSFLINPNSGKIKYFDQSVNEKTVSSIKRQTTLLMQETALLNRTIFANVAYGLQIRKDSKEIRNRVIKSLEAVGLRSIDYLSRNIQQLSGGEAKRVALASRIVLRPKVLLLDEPFAHIDKKSKQLILQTLANLVNTGCTIILSSHNLSDIDLIANNVIELKNGKVL